MEVHSTQSTSSKSSLNHENQNTIHSYEKKFDDIRRKEDRYKEKIEKHLKNLASDRHELEDEILRQGKKISDLQKALTDLQLSVFDERERFLRVSAENEELKRNEEKLHANMRDLLSMTRQKELKDRIIYILNKPRVEVGVREDGMTTSDNDLISRSFLSKKLSREVEALKSQLDEVLKVSKSRSDLAVQECREALERSREKLLQDREQFVKLQKSQSKVCKSAENVSSTSRDVAELSSSVGYSDINSFLEKIHMNLLLLSRAATRVSQSLNAMQATKIYHKMQNISDIPTNLDVYVNESTIEDLEVCLRHCTRLTFDINNIYKSLNLYLTKNNLSTSEFKCLGDILDEMTASSAETDIFGMSLKRYNFFDVLKGTRKISKDSRATQLDDFKKMVDNIKTFSRMVNEMLVVIEGFVQIYKRKSELSQTDFIREGVKSTQSLGVIGASQKESVPLRKVKSLSQDLENLSDIYKRTMKEAENLGFGASSEAELLSKKLEATQRLITSNELYEKMMQTLPQSDMLSERMTQTKTRSDMLSERMTQTQPPSDMISERMTQTRPRSDMLSERMTQTHPHSSKLSERMTQTHPHSSKLSERMTQTHRQQDELSERMTQTHRQQDELSERMTQTHRQQDELSERMTQTQFQQDWFAERMTQTQPPQDLLSERTTQTQPHQDRISERMTQTQPHRERMSERMTQTQPRSDGMHERVTQTYPQQDRISERMAQTDPQSESHLLSEMIIRNDSVLNEINEALSKVKDLEKSVLTKQDPRCLQLAEKINAINEKFRELVDDISMQSLQEQLSTYSQKTLRKLQELAEQSRNAVVAAESQIAAHRSNAKLMSQKLLETEELLRESVNECLSLKQRMKRDEEKRDLDKLSFTLGLKERLDKMTSQNEIKELIGDIIDSISNGEQANIIPQTDSSCVRCSQGHQLCDQKIKDLRAEERKARTELKLLKEEMRKEKTVSKNFRALAEKSSSELNLEKENYKKTVESLESKNASLVEQLKLVKKQTQSKERFYRLQIEGCQTDIRNLKSKIRELEKQLVKAVMTFESSLTDMSFLKTVHATAQHTKEATVGIRRLKAKLYELENNIKTM